MSACFCGEFDRPTVAPDEFGETCFHDLDKCEVPPRRVPDDAVIRVLRQKVTRLTEALEARVAALEARPYHGVLCVDCGYRLDEPDPSNSPGGLGDAPDNTPGGDPVPQWRAMVDSWAADGVMGEAEDPLAAVLWLLHRVSLLQGVDKREVADALARIVAVCEGQVGDGWQADPGRVPHGHWGIAWLLAPLSHEPPDWVVVADRAAAWLRSLTDGAS